MRAGYHPTEPDNSGESLKKQGFYHSPAWRKCRKLALQRDHYQCTLRISPKCSRVATEVHHKKALEDFPELAFDLDNLASCCWWCHEETKTRQRQTLPSGVRIIRMGHEGDGAPEA